MQNQSKNRIAACITALALIFVLFFSTFYIGEHQNHECSGEDCAICIIMEQCGNTLKTIGTAILAAVSVAVVFSILQEKASYKMPFSACNSLISQKVRMNN